MAGTKVSNEELAEAQRELLALIDQCAPHDDVTVSYARYIYLRTNRNMVRTAMKLGVDRRTLYRWMPHR